MKSRILETIKLKIIDGSERKQKKIIFAVNCDEYIKKRNKALGSP
jgi:hypothetical protein